MRQLLKKSRGSGFPSRFTELLFKSMVTGPFKILFPCALLPRICYVASVNCNKCVCAGLRVHYTPSTLNLLSLFALRCFDTEPLNFYGMSSRHSNILGLVLQRVDTLQRSGT